MKSQNVVWAIVLFALAGCIQTRDPNPVSIKQHNDDKLACGDIEVEYKTNTEVATNKISKNNSDDGQDALLGILVWPGLADFKNADGVEGNALLDRNVYLRELSIKMDCDIRAWPTQPTRYT